MPRLAPPHRHYATAHAKAHLQKSGHVVKHAIAGRKGGWHHKKH